MRSQASDIYRALKPLPVIEVNNSSELEPHFESKQPFIVRGLVRSWPLVQAGLKSGKVARDYLLNKAVERPFMVNMGSEDFSGRIFYREDMSMNVQTGRAKLPVIFDRIDEVENAQPPPIIYLSAINIKNFFEGLHEANHVNLDGKESTASIWIGTKSRIAAHNDFPDNLACVAVGQRRFTLFPPDDLKNLYIGPIDNTPAGRPISLVDFHNPDFEKFPKFAQALENGLSAVLEPGDAIHIPSMWWHHVEGMSPFNVLVNYWWRNTPRYMGRPQYALNHAMMAIRDLPAEEKAHWQDLFKYYVFENGADVTAHIPELGRGVLNPMTAQNASKIRSFLIKMLSSE